MTQRHYWALGDSMSIDLYTGKVGGGAASQFAARLSAATFEDHTLDDATTQDILAFFRTLEDRSDRSRCDVVTLTIGGNDLLAAVLAGTPPQTRDAWRERAAGVVSNLNNIIGYLRLLEMDNLVIFNTVYDPTDGDDARLLEMGLPVEARAGLVAYNLDLHMLVRTMDPRGRRFLLCDTHALFKGHGYWSQDPWLTQMIEPNLAGATALADDWLRLVASS